MIRPAFNEFCRHARTATLVPIVKSISADLLTPVSAFLAIAAGEPEAFLLESVEGGEKIGRYTFLGIRPFLRLESRGDQITIRDYRGEPDVLARPSAVNRTRSRAGASKSVPKIETHTASVFDVLKELLHQYRPASIEGLPPFTAGAVGYFAYDIVRQLEDISPPENSAAHLTTRARSTHARDDLNVPDCIFMFFDRVLAFDHVRHQIHIVASADVSAESPKAAYDRALRDIEQIERKLAAPLKPLTRTSAVSRSAKLKIRARTPRPKFLENVERAKEYIAAGDIFQVVLSQRWDFEPEVAPFDLYRSLRTVNPSPYMYFLRFGNVSCGADTLVRENPANARTIAGETLTNKKSIKKANHAGATALHVLGSSPEMLVRVTGSNLEYRPIAGTHPRGKDEAEDSALEKKMLADEKERAEHVMLVDLGRNDLGRVSEYGSVKVCDLMFVERYSHVMHIVSALEGRLRPELDALDAFAACFPAGTLTGAPKVRAMQIIEELEPARRAIYGGSVLYADFAGNLDSCIAIRTLLMKGEHAHLQAGAGIVADSDPNREFAETANKSKAILRAVEMAKRR